MRFQILAFLLSEFVYVKCQNTSPSSSSSTSTTLSSTPSTSSSSSSSTSTTPSTSSSILLHRLVPRQRVFHRLPPRRNLQAHQPDRVLAPEVQVLQVLLLRVQAPRVPVQVLSRNLVRAAVQYQRLPPRVVQQQPPALPVGLHRLYPQQVQLKAQRKVLQPKVLQRKVLQPKALQPKAHQVHKVQHLPADLQFHQVQFQQLLHQTCTLFNMTGTNGFVFPSNQTSYTVNQIARVYCRFGMVHSNGQTAAAFICTQNGWDSTPASNPCVASLGLSTVAPTNVTCPPLSLNLNNTLTPRSNYAVLNTTQTRGTLVAQICNSGFVLSQSRSPINVYVCQSTGNWTSNISDNNCVAGP
ncbi:hypothetical protein M3Y96_00302900 [Aphelenchoides besseyi]|nr:hypothetical protein M3Y96_00302900 [Aphelenchoides besseyi]